MTRALFVTLLAAGFALADDERANLKGLQSFQGKWQLVEMQRGGMKVAEETIRDSMVIFTKDRYKIFDKAGKVVEEGQITVHPEMTPLLIEVGSMSGVDKGKKWHGIYEIEGPVLRAVMAPVADKRPTRLVEPPAHSRGFTLKREATKK